MRALLLAALFLISPLAGAQTAPAPDTAQIVRLLGAIWRPLPPANGASPQALFERACAGALDEMAAFDDALPDPGNPAALRLARPQASVLIVPTAPDSTQVYIFPSTQLPDIAAGRAVFTIVDTAQGRLDLRDAAGAVAHLQLGVAGGKAMMRVLRQGQAPLSYVGCASTAGSGEPQ